MSNLLSRAITGALFVALLVWCILSGPKFAAVLFLPFTVVGIFELNRILKTNKQNATLSMFLGILGYLSVVSFKLNPENIYYAKLLLAALFVVGFINSFISKKRDLSVLFSLIYVAIPFGVIVNLVNLGIDLTTSEHKNLALSFFIMLWCNDTFAYVFGRLLGKNKLAPSISPGKTWEGFIGGALMAVIAGLLISNYYYQHSVHLIILAAIIVVFGTLGDLMESKLKRLSGMKDSGTILPGHGGVLDRFDGALLAAPMFLTYLYIINL